MNSHESTEIKISLNEFQRLKLEKDLIFSLVNDETKQEEFSILVKDVSPKPNLNVKNHQGNTPLILACKKDQSFFVKQLVEAKADPNIQNKNGDTALHILARKNQCDTNSIMLLLEAKADLNYKAADGNTAFYLWARRADCHSDFIKLLIKKNADLNLICADGDNALHALARRSDGGLELGSLIEAKAVMETKNRHGRTPLMLATEVCNWDFIKTLVEAKANLEAVSTEEETPLLMALERRYPATATALIEAKANLEASNKNGETPLLVAVTQRDLISTKALIEAKANVEAVNKEGKTALLVLLSPRNDSRSGYIFYPRTLKETFTHPIAQALVDAKANTEVKGSDGKTPLWYAVYNENFAMVEVLIAAKANVKVQDENHKTLLFLAAGVRNFKITEALLEAKADVNSKDINLETPLWCAVSRNNIDLIKVLLNAKADVNEKNKDGKTLLLLAAKRDSDAIKLLLEEKATPTDEFKRLEQFRNTLIKPLKIESSRLEEEFDYYSMEVAHYTHTTSDRFGTRDHCIYKPRSKHNANVVKSVKLIVDKAVDDINKTIRLDESNIEEQFVNILTQTKEEITSNWWDRACTFLAFPRSFYSHESIQALDTTLAQAKRYLEERYKTNEKTFSGLSRTL